jgi:hypothetical protein
MVNYLNQLQNPQLKSKKIFKVLCDFRKGGLHPDMFDDFINTIDNLPQIIDRTPADYHIFDKFNLTDVSEKDFQAIMREVQKRAIIESKICWHPLASEATCDTDGTGKIKISAAHSIQNNGVLSQIAEDGVVMGYVLDKAEFGGTESHKNQASTFWGFCNIHDSIFQPIENFPYKGTDLQNFLFAYRGFVISAHKKKEVSEWMDFGEQSDNDIVEVKKIFDNAIVKEEYSTIKTEVFDLDKFYPIVVSSAFYLDFDFEGNPIEHSDERIEDIFITLLPLGNKTLFLLSYLEEDEHLYGNLGDQLRKRDSLKSDITMLVAAHTENVYFNPIYYKTFIEKIEGELEEVHRLAQFDLGEIKEGDEYEVTSLTPSNYLNNSLGITFFGY